MQDIGIVPKYVQEYVPIKTQNQCLIRTDSTRICSRIEYVHEIFEQLIKTKNTAQNNVFVVVLLSSYLTLNKNIYHSSVFTIDFKYAFSHWGEPDRQIYTEKNK